MNDVNKRLCELLGCDVPSERSASGKKFDENDHVLIAESLMVDDILLYIQGNSFPLVNRVKLEKKFSRKS